MPSRTIPGRRGTPRPARLAGLLLTVTLATATTAATAGPALAAPPATTQAPGPAAAGWLARQLVDGQRLETTFNGTAFPDQGLTADAVLAFDAAGVAQSFAENATAWLARPDVLTGYVGDGDGGSFAGPHAKIALVAEAQGEDPTSFGGVDLISALLALQAPSGRFSDDSQFGDFSNGITQALAVIALQRHGGAPPAAVDFLVGTQCPDGGFPLTLEQPTCSSDVDTTGFVAQALLATDRTAAADRALDWLESVQQPDGGFGGSPPTTAENANSTGLAAVALRAGGRTGPADRAAAFLTSLQVGCTGQPADRGAVALDATGFDPATATRATAQAVPGLVGVSLAEVSADGATDDAPTLDCASAPSPSPTPAPTSPAGSSPAGTPPATGPQGSTTPTRLASTGLDPRPLVVPAVLALLAGVGLLLVSRPRRAAGEDQR